MFLFAVDLTHLEAVRYNFTHSNTCDWREKKRPYATVALMIEGVGKFVTPEESFTIKRGDVVFIPNGTNYISHWQGNPHSYLSVHFSAKNGCAQCEARSFKLQKLTGMHFVSTLQALESIRVNLERGGIEGLSAVGDFFKFYSSIAPRLKPSKGYDAAIRSVQNAIDFLETGPNEISVGHLADLCHLSESRFYTLFRLATGTSPIRYKNNLLIRRAIQFLKSGMSIQNVSDELGFSTPSYFRRVFKQVTGKNKKEYIKDINF